MGNHTSKLEQDVVALMDAPPPRTSVARRLWDSVASDLSDMALIFGAIIIVLVPTGGIGFALGGPDGLVAGLFIGMVILAVGTVMLLIVGAVFAVRLVVNMLRRDR